METPGLAELESIVARVIERMDIEEPDVTDITFLLRHYHASEREDVADVIGEALAVALTKYALEPDVRRRAGWLLVFRAATEFSDDDRLPSAAGFLIGSLARETPSLTGLVDACASIEACLVAADLGDARGIIAAAIDELERVIGRAYKPGGGIAGGDLHDHACAASTLLTAYNITGRLPYAMLAEELMQSANRFAWNTSGFGANCAAASVLCRLAALHADEDYCRAAVITVGANYRNDAARVLAAQASHACGVDAAAYGLALGEYLALTIESPDTYDH